MGSQGLPDAADEQNRKPSPAGRTTAHRLGMAPESASPRTRAQLMPEVASCDYAATSKKQQAVPYIRRRLRVTTITGGGEDARARGRARGERGRRERRAACALGWLANLWRAACAARSQIVSRQMTGRRWRQRNFPLRGKGRYIWSGAVAARRPCAADSHVLRRALPARLLRPGA